MLGLIAYHRLKLVEYFYNLSAKASSRYACDWHFSNAVLLIDWLPLTSAKNQTFIVRENHNMFKHEDSFITFRPTKNERYFSKRQLIHKTANSLEFHSLFVTLVTCKNIIIEFSRKKIPF